MSPHRFNPPQALVIALLMSPALIALHSCGEEKEELSHHASPQTRSAPHQDQAADWSPPLSRDLQTTLDSLTAADAHRLRSHLRADLAKWPHQVAPFYRAWGKLDPEAALGSATTEAALSLSATLAALRGWTEQDPRGALAWLDGQEPNVLRTRHATALIQAWPAGELSTLASWARDSPPLLPAVTARWSRADPLAAAKWLASLPNSPHHQRAAAVLFRQWAQDDPGSAGDYLVANQSFSNRDISVAAYASTVVADNPQAATLWAREISDATLRERVLKDLPSLQPLDDSPTAGLPRR